MSTSLAKIVIVGRPNVGKSSILNMLARRRISIVDPTAGVTRDRVTTTIEIPPLSSKQKPACAELIDTGGYGIEDTQNLTADVEGQIVRGMEQADLIMFIVDARSGLTPLDHAVAKVLRTTVRRNVSIMQVANKVDNPELEADGYEAANLGFGDPIMVSATTGYNKDALYERIRSHIDFEAMAKADPAATARPDAGVLVAIVGKRNAGKSTLVNSLAGEERVIVSEVEGTTRDSVDVRLDINDQRLTLIDTAGVRKRKSIAGDIEYYSMHRSLRSVRRADVCLLLIDAAVRVSQVDKQLANEITKHFRATVIVVNKWDLAEENYTQQEYVEYLDDSLGCLGYAPVVFVSAIDNRGVRDALAMAMNLYQQTNHRVGTGEINRLIAQLMALRGPSAKGGKRARIYYATQIDVNPPTIILHVNHPDIFDNNYQRFLLNRLRDELPYSEVPINLIIRGKPDRHDHPIPGV